MEAPRNENPYASPEAADDFVSPKIDTVNSVRYRGTLQSFRTLMHLLGGIWIAIGVLCAVAMALVFSLDMEAFIALIILVVGGLWLGLGIATCLKQLWAVYVGLVLSYLSAISNLVQLNFCALVIVIPTIILAHLALARAGELRRAGIPLRVRPGDLSFGNSAAIPNFDYLQRDD